jgi:glycerol-3-phosphate dehydrogenase
LILSTGVRGQVFFVIPMHRGLSLIGTTDQPHQRSPDDLQPTSEEVAQLIENLFRFFPRLRHEEPARSAVWSYAARHVRGVYWGLRPLIRQARRSTLHASREHRLFKEAKGLWSLPGVKLTAARAAGEQVAREAWRLLRGTSPPRLRLVTLPGGDCEVLGSIPAQVASSGCSEGQIRYLLANYGAFYTDVLSWAERDPTYRDRVLADEFWIYAEVAYTVHREMVLTLTDFLWRRTRWARLRRLPDATLLRIAQVIGGYLDWSAEEVQEQVSAFRRELARHSRP